MIPFEWAFLIFLLIGSIICIFKRFTNKRIDKITEIKTKDIIIESGIKKHPADLKLSIGYMELHAGLKELVKNDEKLYEYFNNKIIELEEKIKNLKEK